MLTSAIILCALPLFSVGEGWVALSMHPEEYPPRKDYERIAYKSFIVLRACTIKQLCYCIRNHAALTRISANADFSTQLKCLASGKKSIEQLRPSPPRQTSALELLVVCCFHILLVYPCAL